MLAESSPDARQQRRGESQYTLKLKARQSTCQVTGCLTELPNKAYHQRYKICQTHAAMPQMVLEGRHVRFCQHCGRFQALQEFDGAFKSCRKSLQRHRTSQSRRIRTKSSTKASSGSEDMSGGATATKIPPTRNQKSSYGRTIYPNSSNNDTEDSNNNEDTQSPYDDSTPGGSGVQTQSVDGSLGGPVEKQQQCRSSSNRLVPMFGFPPGVAEEIYSALNGIPATNLTSDGATPPATTPPIVNGTSGNLEIPLGPIPCTNVMSGTFIDTEPEPVVGMDLIPIHEYYDDTNDSDWIPNLIDGGGGAVGVAAGAVGTMDEYIDPAPRLAPLPSIAAVHTEIDAAAAGRNRGAARAMASLLASHHHHHDGFQPTAAAPATTSQHQPMMVDNPHSSLDAALNILAFDYPNTLGEAHDGSTVMRASLKLFNTHPEHLPMSVRDALVEVMATSDTFLTANARPGCVHITANVVLNRSEARALETAGAKGLLTGALAQGPSLIPPECLEGPQSAFLAQINTQIAALGVSGTIASVCIDATSDASSDICAVVPLAMTPTNPQHVTLLGKRISGDLDMVVCRRGEDTPNLGVLSSGPSQRLQERNNTTSGGGGHDLNEMNNSEASGSGASSSRASLDQSASESTPQRTTPTLSTTTTTATTRTTPAVSLPCTWYPPGCFTGRGLAAGEYVQFSLIEVKEGLHNIEIQKGSMLSPTAQSLLVIDDDAVVAELRQLEVDATGVADIPAFVQAVGIVVEHLKLRRQGGRHPNGSLAVAQRITPLAASIVTTAIARRWPALLRLICAAASPADVQASITALSVSNSIANDTTAVATDSAPDELSLLHLVAASGCVELVQALDVWGKAAGHTWLCQPIGRASITPLHIAAIVDDGAAMATALTTLFGTVCHGSWYGAKGADGVTPAQAAKIAGNEAVLEFLGTHLPREAVYSEEIATSGSAEMSSGLRNRKLSSTSFGDAAPPCPDEWPYSTFYGSNGLLRDSTGNTAAHQVPNTTRTTSNSSTSPSTGLNVGDDQAAAIGVALSIVTGLAALAVRFLYG